MERPFDFAKRLLQVHKPNRLNSEKAATLTGTKITADWHITTAENAPKLIKNVAWDLNDYFAVSMNVTVPQTTAQGSAPNTIWIALDETLPERSFRILVTDDSISIYGSNDRAAAQGCYALEDMCNLNEAPIVAPCDKTMQMRFSPRMINSGMPSGNDLPDEHLRLMAHYGFDATMIGTRNILTDPEYCQKANEIIERAANWGLDIYSFISFKNTVHPDEPGAFEHYEGMHGKLVELCPNIKGLIVVGESCEFPSKDPRTTGKSWRESKEDDKPSPGWFPCDDYAQFVTMLRDVIHKHNPNVELVFWTYNWGYEREDLRLKLLRSMPENVTLMATFEMFENIEVLPGVVENTIDYTLWCIGPGVYFSTESATAREMGRRMYSMTNTGGNTWDIGGVPYLPSPQRWIERWNAVVDAQDNMQLDGIRESHSYGFWPSIMPELAKYAFMKPMPDLNDLLRKLVIRDFGEENVEQVLSAMNLFSEGMSHCVSTNPDQWGPARVGPVYPLVFQKPELMPAGPDGRGRPNYESDIIYKFNLDLIEKLRYETKEYESMARLFDAGCDILRSVIDGMEGQKAKDAQFMLGVAAFIGNTARTIQHVKRWHDLKGQLGIYLNTKAIWPGGRKHMPDTVEAVKPLVPAEDPVPIVLEMIEIAHREIANAEATIPYVEADSRLGFNQEFEYTATAEQLRWKIEYTKRVINEELLPLLNK